MEQTDLGVKIFAKIQPKEKDDDVKMTSPIFVRWADGPSQERGSNTIPQLISFEPLSLRTLCFTPSNQETTLDNGQSSAYPYSSSSRLLKPPELSNRAKLSDKQ